MRKGSSEKMKKLSTINMIITNIGLQFYIWYLVNLTMYMHKIKKAKKTCIYFLNLIMCYAT